MPMHVTWITCVSTHSSNNISYAWSFASHCIHQTPYNFWIFQLLHWISLMFNKIHVRIKRCWSRLTIWMIKLIENFLNVMWLRKTYATLFSHDSYTKNDISFSYVFHVKTFTQKCFGNFNFFQSQYQILTYHPHINK